MNKNKTFESMSAMYNDFNKDAMHYEQFWKDHQSVLSSLLETAKYNLNHREKSIIIGAGNCNDISLNDYTTYFESTTLVDIDRQSMLSAKNRLEPSLQQKVRLQQEDLSGIYEDKELLKFINLLKNFKTEDALKKLEHWCKTVCTKNISSQKFDMVVSSTVASQLISTSLEICVQQFARVNRNALFHGIQTVSDQASLSHIQQIHRLLNNNGIALITSEQFEYGVFENKSLPNNKLVSSPVDMLDPAVQIVLEEKGTSVSGRITDDMLTPTFDILESREWVWQLNKDRHYLVKGWLVKVK